MNRFWRGVTWLPRRSLALLGSEQTPERTTAGTTETTEAERRIDDARERLRTEIPPPDDD